MVSASWYPNFNLETVDLEVLSGMRRRQNRERGLCSHQSCRSLHQNEENEETGVVIVPPELLCICPVSVPVSVPSPTLTQGPPEALPHLQIALAHLMRRSQGT